MAHIPQLVSNTIVFPIFRSSRYGSSYITLYSDRKDVKKTSAVFMHPQRWDGCIFLMDQQLDCGILVPENKTGSAMTTVIPHMAHY